MGVQEKLLFTCNDNEKKPERDKGWCWVMFIAVCVIMFMVFGIHYTYGILYPFLLKEFNKGEGQTGKVILIH